MSSNQSLGLRFLCPESLVKAAGAFKGCRVPEPDAIEKLKLDVKEYNGLEGHW